MPTLLITGANRGLGLEFVKQYGQEGWRILACCRQPEKADALRGVADLHKNITLHALDVGDFEAIAALAAKLSNESLDLLICNAGIFPDRSLGLGSIDYDGMARAFRINSLAPLRIAEAFVGHLERGNKPVFCVITSKMGSIDDNTSGGCYAYRTSKAAVNMIAKNLSHDLAQRGISALVLHPGWVKTDMGGEHAPLGKEASIAGMRQVIADMEPARSGKFFAYDGAEVSW